ncbi:unnamed protein product, partial [Effrenium voratum]
KFNIGPLAKALHLVCAVRQRTQVLHLTHRQLSPLRPCTYIEMAAIDWLPVVRAGMVSMWIELSFMIFFALGFVLLRNGVFSFLGPGNAKKGDYGKSSRRAAQFSSKSKKIIEAEASSGNAKEVLKAWRLGQGAPTPKELFKVVVQAFIDAEPESLV